MLTSECASCKELVGDGPECSVCKKKFHFKCGGITERGYSRLGTGRASWMCTTCRDSSKTGLDVSKMEDSAAVGSPSCSRLSSGLPLEQGMPSVSTPKPMVKKVKDEKDNASYMSLLSDISSKISNMQVKLDAIEVIQQDLHQVKSDIADLKVAVNDRFDQLAVRVEDIESRLTLVESMKSEVESLKEQLREVLNEGHKNEQWVRRSNIQINGIPQKNGENLIKIVKTLAERCNFSLDPDRDIDFVTRVAVKNDIDGKKIKPIILKMQSRYKKDDLLTSLRKLNIKASDMGFVGGNGRIYFNNHLSSRNKQLLQQAKLRAKEKNYTYCWVRNCTIMVRKSENSPVIHITSQECLKKIV